MFANIPEVMIFGEDVGKIGVVNQGVEGLQEKFGETIEERRLYWISYPRHEKQDSIVKQ